MRSVLSSAMVLAGLACAGMTCDCVEGPRRVDQQALTEYRGGNPMACAVCWNDSSTSPCNECFLYGGAAPAGTFAKCQTSDFNDGYFVNAAYTTTQCSRTSTACGSNVLLLYNGGTCDAPHYDTVPGGCTNRYYLNGTTIAVFGQGCTGITPGAYP